MASDAIDYQTRIFIMKHGFDAFLVIFVGLVLAIAIFAEEWPAGFDAMTTLVVDAVNAATDVVSKP
jgi:hypothetical protein|nr:MAG TPA: protein of unknown function DUF2149 [Caudoviricetes sp.]